MNWNKAYGNGWEKYPVKRGELWTVGDHQILCEDWHLGPKESYERITNIVPDMIYIDPPWNQGNAKSFRTKAGVPEPKLEWPHFVEKLVSIVKQCKGDVYVEMGQKELGFVLDMFEGNGAMILNIWDIVYYKTKPCILFRANFANTGQLIPEGETPEGMDDEDTPKWAIEHSSKEGDLIADYCTGQGGTPVWAHTLGRRFIGTELNERRMANSVMKLASFGLEVTTDKSYLEGEQ